MPGLCVVSEARTSIAVSTEVGADVEHTEGIVDEGMLLGDANGVGGEKVARREGGVVEPKV